MELDETTLRSLQDESTRRAASMLHYLTYHAGYVQFYHELRLSVGDDVGKLSDLLSRAQRELVRLKDDDEHKEYVSKMRWPSADDIMTVQRHHAKFGKMYVQLLLGIAAGVCSRCISEKGGE